MLATNEVFRRLASNKAAKGERVRPNPTWRHGPADLPKETKRPTLLEEGSRTCDVLGFNAEGKSGSQTFKAHDNLKVTMIHALFLAEQDCFGQQYIDFEKEQRAYIGNIGRVQFLTGDADKKATMDRLARWTAEGVRSVFNDDDLKRQLEEGNFWFFETTRVHQVLYKPMHHDLSLIRLTIAIYEPCNVFQVEYWKNPYNDFDLDEHGKNQKKTVLIYKGTAKQPGKFEIIFPVREALQDQVHQQTTRGMLNKDGKTENFKEDHDKTMGLLTGLRAYKYEASHFMDGGK